MPGGLSLPGLAGRRALVTGAARGIGKGVAAALQGQGAEVVITDLESAELRATAAELRCGCVAADLSSTEECERVVREAGDCDLFVHAAGIAVFDTFLDTKASVFDKTIAINTRAGFLLMQGLAKKLVAKGRPGSMVLVSSVSSGVVVSERHFTYATSKAAVDQVTRTAGVMLAKHNVRVNAIRPCVVRTELALKAHGEEGFARVTSKVPMGRALQVEEVANVALFLLSDAAAMVTGVSLPVDGGFVGSRM
eukprot:TRINITY_DN16752_c0_g1_i1.p1 TRINITY_DN16752_c0_g1~~TRINITY_DN16752_c0_g1_i1.p1  ORF type:complete len:251 (+),score=78.51 TRINITY_DN16752_c0_g1_i1:70-822(+)